MAIKQNKLWWKKKDEEAWEENVLPSETASDEASMGHRWDLWGSGGRWALGKPTKEQAFISCYICFKFLDLGGVFQF